ncbi:chymotrypsin-like protease CTRL-1 [Aplysia californica]|uniref:Chymotrypsin-like protease CTRL-1 n=1 Tax=Aplysia californica TaxID=6500 RepID=A0ABM0K2I9_APLCA|nr:chymotrypsin-like protease CTRL-1 [Aplysia californica]
MGTSFHLLVAFAVALCTASLATAQDDYEFYYDYDNLLSFFSTSEPQGPVNTPVWGPWSGFGPCSTSCGGGIQSRSRTCSTGNNKDCTNQTSLAVESQKCNTQDCPKTNAPSNNTSSNGQCGQANNFRIIGGSKSASCEYPWMVVVFDHKNGFLCGGSIIDESTILTAAHCVANKNSQGKEVPSAPSDMAIYSGSSKFTLDSPPPPGLRANSASKIIVHEKYNVSGYLDNDIALIKLSKPLTLDRCQRPVCLVDGSKTPQPPPPLNTDHLETTARSKPSYGPDAESPDDMFWAAVSITSDKACEAEYGRYGTVTAMCAMGNNEGSCQGDSGGPVVCKEADGRYYQYGIVSGGRENKCAKVIGIYTRVSAFLTWINKHRN